MKRLICYCVLLAILLIVPVTGVDVARLRPVEVVHLYQDGSQIVIETDTKDTGVGHDALSAFQNLVETTAGYIYLDTAEFFLIDKNVQEQGELLRPMLKEKVFVCFAQPKIDLEEAARFLPAHGTFPQLRDWENGVPLPYLTAFGKRLKLS